MHSLDNSQQIGLLHTKCWKTYFKLLSFVSFFSELLCHVWASAKSCSCWFNEQFSTKYISTWNVSTTPTSTTDKVSQKELQQIDLVVPARIFLRFWFRINRKFRRNSAKVFRIWIGCNVWERRWRHGRLSVVEKNMFNVFMISGCLFFSFAGRRTGQRMTGAQSRTIQGKKLAFCSFALPMNRNGWG